MNSYQDIPVVTTAGCGVGDVYSPNGFGLTEDGRRFSAQLTVDIYL